MYKITFPSSFFGRRLRRYLQEHVVRDLCSSAIALQDLETEFNQLQEDREILRKIIPSGNSKVRTYLNFLHWLIGTFAPGGQTDNLHYCGAWMLVRILSSGGSLIFLWHCFILFFVRLHYQWILAVWFGMPKRPFILRTEHQVTFTLSEWPKVQDARWKFTDFVLPRIGYHMWSQNVERPNQWTVKWRVKWVIHISLIINQTCLDERFTSLLRTDREYTMDWKNAANKM